MKSRLEALEARRRALLGKCEEQRLELAYRVAQIKPSTALGALTGRSRGSAGKSPLTWIAGLVGVLMLLRRRRKGIGSGVGWIAGLLALATRATTILRVIAQIRAIYLGFKAAKRPGAREGN
jgi:hypothetical protein